MTTRSSNSKGILTSSQLIKAILVLSIAANVLMGYLLSREQGGWSAYGVVNTKWYNRKKSDAVFVDNQKKAQTKLFELLPNEEDETIFLGTSITAGFPVQELFGDHKIKNRGIAYSSTADILTRMGTIVGSKPKKIIVEAGINDIIAGIPTDSILSNIKKILAVIELNSPKTKTYVQSVFPSSLKKSLFIPKIVAYNRVLKDYCQQQNVVFIDLYPLFLKNGTLDDSLTFDGIHLTGKGYLLWKQSIQQYVND